MITDELSSLFSILKRGEIDYLISTENLDRDELVQVQLGVEQNVLVQKKGYAGPDLFLDHDEEDQMTVHYLKKAKKKGDVERHYLDDAYGILEGVRLGFGRAVLPVHLVQNEKSLEILDPHIVLEVPVFLYFYSQPFYSRLHKETVKTLEDRVGEWL
jgi:DNA-binding transcriptional LysR family regulator